LVAAALVEQLLHTEQMVLTQYLTRLRQMVEVAADH
jgi:hypothetical protein